MADRPGPLPVAKWPRAAVKDAFAPLMPPADQPRREGTPKGMNVLGLQAWHPALAQAFNTFQRHLLYESELTARQRELVVLRVSHRRRSEYEWAQHVATAGDNGIEPGEVARIPLGPDATEWSDHERALLRATDELVDDGRIADETWRTLAEVLDEKQILDVIFTVGAYDVMAMALRSFDVPLDDDLVGFAASDGGDRDGDGR
jgi:alkylhydroperoxidase family enzyme